MTPENWAKITNLFGEVLELPAQDREAFLLRLSGEDPAAARELASLLDQNEKPDDFLPPLPSSTPTRQDFSGRLVGAYRLIQLLGRGGMGAVYLAERTDGAFYKRVAVKLLYGPFLHSFDRLHNEREVLARLDHQNIARLLDGGTTPDGLPYLVMEYVDGIPMDRYCCEHDVSFEQRIALLIEVCAGIAHAHRNLIIHRDIKPENILVSSDGVVKLVDFGIAKLLDDAINVTFQRPATPAYSSPEQLRGEPVTTASDVYSLGVLAYVLLTGASPYPLRSGRLDELLQAVLTAEPLRASLIPGLAAQKVRKLRGDLDNILLMAMARDPERRYASAQQFADDLENHRKGFPVRARPDRLSYRFLRFVGRYRIASAFAALATIFLIVGIVVTTRQARVSQRRFQDLRQFAHSVVFDVNDSLSVIPGTITAQEQLVETALRYLDRLNNDNLRDRALLEELAAAYIRIGRVQGGAFVPNLGDSRGAAASFRKAIAAIGPSPATPALQRLSIEAHINQANLELDPAQALPEFQAVFHAGEQQLAAHPEDLQTLRLMADAYHAVATIGHLTDQVGEEERMSAREREYRQRILEQVPTGWREELNLAKSMAQHALAMEQEAEYESSLSELRSSGAKIALVLRRYPGNELLLRELADDHSRAGRVCRSLGRLQESQAELEIAVPMLESIVLLIRIIANIAAIWLMPGHVWRKH